MRAFRPSPVRTAWRMHSALMTGSMPGIAASTRETCELGSPPNAVDAPENNLAWEVTWACTSRPMTTSQSPLAPLRSFETVTGASMIILPHRGTWPPRKHYHRSLRQQGFGDRLPFILDRGRRHRLARLLVPILGVRQIAFDAMKMRVDPGGVGSP